MNRRLLPSLKQAVSPDLVYLGCPDCGGVVHVATTFIDGYGYLYMSGCCDECADHRTITARYDIDDDAWVSLYEAGTPVVETRQR